MALRVHIEDMDKAVDEEPRKHFAQTEGRTLPLDTVVKTSSGVFGKSTTASAEKGEDRRFDTEVQKLKNARLQSTK